MNRTFALLALFLLIPMSTTHSVSPTAAHSVAAAQAFRARGEPVVPAPDGNLYCEAEEFRVETPGWQAKPWGENYYAATFANTFLSRKAFLGAPEQCEPDSVARIAVEIREPGRYLVLVRYEAAYRFETQFRLRVEQGGAVKLDRLYGARDNEKIWAFRQKLQKEVCWDWGAVENIVWEGHDAVAELQPGRATITLIAGRQVGDAARRNVDLVLLTTRHDEVQRRIEKENYLPLDGLLTQQGDVFLRVVNRGEPAVKVSGGKWQEHSPYWVHLRDPNVWKPVTITAEPGTTTDWTDVGGTMDTLNDGQWVFETSGPCRLEFGVRDAGGRIQKIAEFEANGKLSLVGFADTRWSRRILTPQQGIAELLDGLKQVPAHGRTPTQTLIIASTAIAEFGPLFGLAVTDPNNALGPRGYVDWRGKTPAQLEELCARLSEEQRNQLAVVSLGDEISLPAPTPAAATEGFAVFLQTRGVEPGSLRYNPDPALKSSDPRTYYWSQRYRHHYGIQEMKKLTDVLRRHLPNARIGANFSPHHGGAAHAYLGPVFQWVNCFRDEGMTLPWSEDYIWQLPVGSPQMNGINLDLFRAGLRGKPDHKIHYYVMPHWPGNTPAMWRRLFHQALGHGMTIVNLFEFHPVWLAYTENHVSSPAMFATVLRAFRELGLYEDIVQSGQIRPSEVGLWFSETADIWGDNAGSFAAAKRALYIAIVHQQRGLDFLVEQDALDGTLGRYRVLFLTDAHVSSAASKRIAEWVRQGGTLFATAGAGMFDEYNEPNRPLRELLGVECPGLEAPTEAQVAYIKQDLPFAKPIAEMEWDGATFPVFGAACRSRGPSVTTQAVGEGRIYYCRFLPGLSYFRPAIPRRPVDRGSADEAMAHFLPTRFDPAIGRLIRSAVAAVKPPIEASEPLVETRLIESRLGAAVVLVNWSGRPLPGLKLTAHVPVPGQSATLATGGKVSVRREDGAVSFVLDLDLADVLILR